MDERESKYTSLQSQYQQLFVFANKNGGSFKFTIILN